MNSAGGETGTKVNNDRTDEEKRKGSNLQAVESRPSAGLRTSARRLGQTVATLHLRLHCSAMEVCEILPHALHMHAMSPTTSILTDTRGERTVGRNHDSVGRSESMDIPASFRKAG